MSGPGTPQYAAAPPLTGRLRVLAFVGGGLAVAAGVVLRCWSPSALWLDEALTVNIARLPLHEIPGRLKQDGAPPLYYYLLHFWMRLFGQSNLATRSLSAIFGVLTLPVAWLAARRLGGRAVAWTTLVLLASAPFAVYYATEARMYALVILLTGCGMLALERSLRTPRPGNLIAVAVVTAALLYSQYWALYLVGTVVIWLLATVWWDRRRSPGSTDWRRPIPTLVAIGVGCLAFAPWLPTFLYQSRYTGTPWAAPANFAAAINVVTGFTYDQASLSPVSTDQGRLLVLIYVGLAALAVFGVGRSGRIVELDLHTRPRARGISFVVLVTVLAAIAGGLLTKSAFSSRYAAVIFLPFLVIVALGTTTLLSARARSLLVALAVAAGLVLSVQSVLSQRTQAPGVATVLRAHAKPGDVVAFCPDQLGPDTYRAITDPGRYTLVTFPRGIGPQFVDWVNYARAVHAASTDAFVATLHRDAGANHSIWLVWMGGYETYGVKCEQLVESLTGLPGVTARQWISGNPDKYYEPMYLTEFTPTGK
ncbi:MAG: glycosyltransferase family 39 protein [Acidimicrobiales bacterium]